MEFQCWGISHKSTSLEVREKFAFNKEKIDEIIENLKRQTPFKNGIFLSTCNRTEFYSFCKRTDIKIFDEYLKHLTDKNINLRKNDQYLFSNNDAFKHLLRVMTGIDSMIVGEPDIFGQVKKSFQNSRELLYLGTELEIIFNRAISLSKDIRSETELSKNPLSIASLVESKILELEKKPILIIGGGDVSKALISRLNERNYELKLFNRSKIKIENLKSNSLEELNSNVSDFQIIVIAASSDSPLFDLLNVSKGTIIFDLAIPRNLPKEHKNSKEIEVLTLDEISEMVKANLKGREEAVKLAEDLIIKKSDSEFSKLKNRKNINNAQKKFHEEQGYIKEIALQNALKKLKDGNKPEDIIEGLAEEIASKNAFHVSKILNQSFSHKKRDN